MTMWMVRAGRGGEALDEFFKRNVVGLAFDGGEAPLPPKVSDAEVLKRVLGANPTAKPLAAKVWAAQTSRFLSEVQVGDLVVTYDRDDRVYFIGEVKSGYVFVDDPRIAHARKVQWKQKSARDALKVDSRNAIGSISTFFQVREDAAKDLLDNAVAVDLPTPQPTTTPKPPAEDVAEIADLRQETIAQSEELIEDRINRLDWDDMQDLVAGILRAMGYKTHVSPPGPDRGYDVFASPDGLGLQDPRIFVEVKHRIGKMGSKEIRSFLGGRSTSDKCLYVSTGGFSKDARYEAERAQVPVRLLDLGDLRKLLLDHYEKLDAETASLVPLRRIYWPTGD